MRLVEHKFDNPFRSVRRPLVWGVTVIGVTFAGFGGWAATAPLSSAAIAQGVVGVSSKRQTVQHLEGGIVAELLVKDGDLVQAGDLLLRLDPTRALANFELMRGQYLAAVGERARLEAERDGLAEIRWPEDLESARGDADADAIIRGQTNVFRSRTNYLAGQEALRQEGQLQLEQEIAAIDAQQKAAERSLELIREELKSVEILYKQGLARQPRLLGLQRAVAEKEGSRGEMLAKIAQKRQAISELNAKLSDTKNRMMTEIVGELRETENEIADIVQRLHTGRDLLQRVDIRAPRNGYIVNLAFHTVGGVIQPGRPILDVVPTDDNLVIEARLNPSDIDVLRIGMPAEITLTPYNTRSVPPVAGTLVSLSADSLTDEKSGERYYAARVEADRSELAHLKDVRLVPGMPVQVMIRTGERTALQYIVDPFSKSINRAFREN